MRLLPLASSQDSPSLPVNSIVLKNPIKTKGIVLSPFIAPRQKSSADDASHPTTFEGYCDHSSLLPGIKSDKRDYQERIVLGSKYIKVEKRTHPARGMKDILMSLGRFRSTAAVESQGGEKAKNTFDA